MLFLWTDEWKESDKNVCEKEECASLNENITNELMCNMCICLAYVFCCLFRGRQTKAIALLSFPEFLFFIALESFDGPLMKNSAFFAAQNQNKLFYCKQFFKKSWRVFSKQSVGVNELIFFCQSCLNLNFEVLWQILNLAKFDKFQILVSKIRLKVILNFNLELHY